MKSNTASKTVEFVDSPYTTLAENMVTAPISINPDFAIVYDPFCEMEDTFFDEVMEDNAPRVLDGSFAQAAISGMDWAPSTSSSNQDPHNEVQTLFTLSSFKPSDARTSSVPAPSVSGPSAVPPAKRLIRGKYRKYNEDQINQLLKGVFEDGQTASAAGIVAGIKPRTAQEYIRKAKKVMLEDMKMSLEEVDDDAPAEEVAPPVVKERKYGNQKLFSEHTAFLINYYDNYPAATLREAVTAICEAFPGLTITPSAIQKHLVKKCNITMKKLEKLVKARNEEKTLEQRRAKILEWQELQDFDYESNCVFIDEAGFNLHIKRTRARSKKGTAAKVEVSTQRGVSITIIGAMCERGIINLVLRKPSVVANKKKRKLGFSATVDVNGRVGTRTSHYLDFLSRTMDTLDAEGMKGRYLVMDNAPIHKAQEVKDLITLRGYKYMYLPTYSPFLNPIEEMWSKIKFGVRRGELTNQDSLLPRTVEAGKTVQVSDCAGWIKHSLSFFDRCLNLEKNL